MPVLTATYAVCFSALAFSGLSALTLIRTISRLDPPDVDVAPERKSDHAAAA